MAFLDTCNMGQLCCPNGASIVFEKVAFILTEVCALLAVTIIN